MIVASLRPGFDPSTEIRELARPIAEAQVDERRVRHARRRLLSDASSDPHYESRADRRMKLAAMQSLLRENTPNIPTADLDALFDVDAGRAAATRVNPIAGGETIDGDASV